MYITIISKGIILDKIWSDVKQWIHNTFQYKNIEHVLKSFVNEVLKHPLQANFCNYGYKLYLYPSYGMCPDREKDLKMKISGTVKSLWNPQNLHSSKITAYYMLIGHLRNIKPSKITTRNSLMWFELSIYLGEVC